MIYGALFHNEFVLGFQMGFPVSGRCCGYVEWADSGSCWYTPDDKPCYIKYRSLMWDPEPVVMSTYG
ncbi:unnamed protein product [marine sediment metagenome]|uniref:Uncharacterized protein n=1 Tax=marine sediment metagenome TaxID=412755 RepID=X0SQK9_9ZZZZ